MNRMTGRITWFTLMVAFSTVFSALPVMAAPSACEVKAQIAPDNQTVYEADKVDLNGRPSKNAATYSWEWVSGPSIILVNPTTDKPSFTAPNVSEAGASVVLRLTVTGCPDRQTTSMTTTVNVLNVTDPNRPPVAAATASPNPVSEGGTVTLDATASNDPDSDLLTYSWTQLSGTAVTLTPYSSGALVTFIAPNVGVDGESLRFGLTVSDAGGLVSKTEVIVTVQWVNAPPVATVSCPESVNEGAEVELQGSGSIDEDDGILTYAWNQLVGPPSVDLSSLNSSADLRFTAPNLGFHQDGKLPFKLTVIDRGGLSASAECIVTILDVTPPTIFGALDVSAEADSAAGAVVEFAPTATDAVDGEIAVSCTPPTGSSFALGSTEVRCSASDQALNLATATFTVTVVDTTPPVVTQPADVVGEASGLRTAVDYGIATASDAVGVVFMGSDAPADFPLGTTIITWSAKDAAGNEGTATSTVTIVDTTPPVVTAPEDVTVLATGLRTPLLVGTATATDAVGVTSLVNDAPTDFPIGTTLITWRARDAAGNEGIAKGTVTVQYVWSGFHKPVDMYPVVNMARAGSAIPVKFSLGYAPTPSSASLATLPTLNRNMGFDIFVNGYPKVASIITNTLNVQEIAEAETVTAGGSSLTYDALANQYVYVWKTDKAWADSSRQLQVKLRDGSTHTAEFRFSK